MTPTAEGPALRIELFPADLRRAVDFYRDVLDFVVERHDDDPPYAALTRGTVRLGLAQRPRVDDPSARRPPTGTEIVIEVPDLAVERERIVGAGWPLDDDVQERPWGLIDLRILDPDGYYLRLTTS